MVVSRHTCHRWRGACVRCPCNFDLAQAKGQQALIPSSFTGVRDVMAPRRRQCARPEIAGLTDMASEPVSPACAKNSASMTTASYSFACGGWLKMYLFGVAKALQEHELEKNARVIGCSAGALAATALALGCNFDAIRDFVVDEVIPKAHENVSGPFQVRSYLQATLRSVGHLDRYEELNRDTEKLSVVYSSLSAWASRRVTRFESQEHLEKSLLASCCAVPIAGMPFKLSGEWVMDGGVFDFQPVFDAHTVTVSAFYCTAADIKPSRYVPMWWAFYPPSQRDVEWLFDLGYEDGLAWIAKTGKAIKTIEMPTKGASYDGQWTTTVGRVVGYRGVESRIVDMLFVGLFVCLWKPLAFVLLYLELYLHAIVSGGKAALFGAAAKLMISSIILVGTIVAMATHSFHDMMVFMLCLLGMGIFLGILVLLSGGIQGAAMVASKDWRKCRACMRNITSLSLFLRTVPVYGSSIVIKRHEYLLEHSMVYRLAMHFV